MSHTVVKVIKRIDQWEMVYNSICSELDITVGQSKNIIMGVDAHKMRKCDHDWIILLVKAPTLYVVFWVPPLACCNG